MLGTNMAPAIVFTDAGRAYIKPLAPDVNPHNLAVEWVCTRLAKWFSLPVLDHSVLALPASVALKRPSGVFSIAGPAFCTRAVDAMHWNGSAQTLSTIANPDDIARLVIFDTWIRNEDRYPAIDQSGRAQSHRRPNLGNVLLVRDPTRARQLQLVAMDFGHAIVAGRELPNRSLGIDAERCELLYGLFPEFRRYVTAHLVEDAVAHLKQLSEAIVNDAARFPPEWNVSEAARTAMCEHLYRRALYLVDTISARLQPLCYPQGTLPGC
ncbi:MAG: HipA family kinase [Phycisphaerae bacterium]